jgi:hypothetical protein
MFVPCKKNIYSAKMQVMIEINYEEYALYAVYAKYGNECDMQNMQNMTDAEYDGYVQYDIDHFATEPPI